MELFTVLDELIDVVENVVVEGRGEQAAIAESAMAEFAAALAPGNDFSAIELVRYFREQPVFARRISVDDLAIVEDGLYLLR